LKDNKTLRTNTWRVSLYQRTESREQMTEHRGQITENRWQSADYGCRKSDYIKIIPPIIQILLLLPLGHVLLYATCPFCP
jgi:hypothetical protein